MTRHWDGQRQYMFGLLTVDNVIYEFMGKSYADDARYSSGYRKLTQTGCEIRPMTDLHFTNEPWERQFHARTVQGGLFINLLEF